MNLKLQIPILDGPKRGTSPVGLPIILIFLVGCLLWVNTVDKLEPVSSIPASKSGSWIDELQSKQDAQNVAEQTNTPAVQPEPVLKKTRRSPSHYPSHHEGRSNMKASVCVSLDNGFTAVRMKRTQAQKLVDAGRAQFAKRSLWKASQRGSVQSDEPVVEVKTKKSKSKH